MDQYANTIEQGKGIRMKRTVLTSLVLVGLLCAGPLAALEYNGPRIEIKEMRYDLGKVVQDSQVSQVIEVRNVGNEQLIIEKVQPS
jgi:hypothetical protein